MALEPVGYQLMGARIGVEHNRLQTNNRNSIVSLMGFVNSEHHESLSCMELGLRIASELYPKRSSYFSTRITESRILRVKNISGDITDLRGEIRRHEHLIQGPEARSRSSMSHTRQVSKPFLCAHAGKGCLTEACKRTHDMKRVALISNTNIRQPLTEDVSAF